MRGLPPIAILLLVTGAVGGGCGGGNGGGSKQPGIASAKNQVAGYLAAFNRGDGPAACALLTPQARAGVPHLSNKINAPDCEGAIRELSGISEHIRSPRITVRPSSNRAIATIKNSSPPYQSDVLLTREGNGWQIAYPPAVLERYKTPPGIPSDLAKRKKAKKSG